MHGIGELIWKDGSKYVGSFKEDIRHGFGKFEWANGKTYIGNWINGKQHGKAIMIFKNNKKTGIWDLGKFIRWIPNCEENSDNKMENY